MKPFIRWLGNKSRYVKYIEPHVPSSFTTYIEPFVGSGALFLHFKPEKWIINDVNKDLVNAWNQVKNNKKRLITYFMTFKIEIENMGDEKKLDYVRELLKTMLSLPFSTKRSALFLLIKFSTFMGTILVKNKFVVTSLDNRLKSEKDLYFLTNKYFDVLDTIHNYLNSSQGIISNVDYKNVIQMAQSNDFVFLDPPYIEDHDYKFTYNQHSNITNEFIDELLGCVRELDVKKVKWLMTQADTPYIRRKFSKYHIHTFKVYRARSNTYKNELIIKNYL
jgi:DNA adenine methylase